MNVKRRVLLALHDPLLQDSISDFIEDFGDYSVLAASSLEDVLEASRSACYHIYIMDANLGRPGEATYEPADAVYRSLAGKADFICITGNNDLVESALKAGVPCVNKLCFPDFFESEYESGDDSA